MTQEPRRVSPSRLRAVFNNGQFRESITKGDLVPTIAKSHHLDDPAAKGEPYCTHSQFVNYFDQNGQRLAGVHRYLRPDGSIGGSGQEDPKRLVVGQEVWISDDTVS